MKISKLFNSFFILCLSVMHSQNDINAGILKEINAQLFNPNKTYENHLNRSNRNYQHLNGPIKQATIIYSDSTIIINSYNEVGSLLVSQKINKNKRKTKKFYDYLEDGKTLIKERGVYNLDYSQINDFRSFAVKANVEKVGINRFLDTIFLNESKFVYKTLKKVTLEGSPVYKEEIRYNDNGDLISTFFFENDIRIGHLVNFYNEVGQVKKQELFLDYEWFYVDSGFSSVRKQGYMKLITTKEDL